MSPDLLGLALGAGVAAGLNLYATAAMLGALQHFGVVQLPGGLGVLGTPVVLGVAVVLFVIEFVADKVPYVDSAWDAVHTFIRPPAAALLAWSAFATVPDDWRTVAALVTGTIALTAHGAKASARAAANTSPEPVSNWLLSTAEDAVALGLSWLVATHPLLAAVVGLVLLVVALMVIRTFVRFFRRIFGALRPVAAVPPNTPTAGGEPPAVR